MTLTHDEAPAVTTARPPSAHKKHSRRRILIVVSIALLVLLLAGLLWEAWSYSSQLLEVSPSQPTYDTRVIALKGNTIELARTDMTTRPGTYGLDWPGGRIVLGPIVAKAKTDVVRTFTGNASGLTAGSTVDFDISPYASPAAFHLAYRTVNVPGPLGLMPAWYIPGKRSTWVLLVHGHASNRAEGMRPLPTLAGLGLPVLDMTYRNDSGAPSSSDHLYHLGATEWQDVQAGVRYALAHGARTVVLYGYSMGGNLVESFLHHSAYAGRVRAVVLDAPALDWSAVLDWHATHSSLPGLFKDVEMPLIKQIAAWRMGMWNLDPLNQVRLTGELKAPTLLFHGTSDTNVPITTSAAFARARPDLVTFVPVAGAEHTSSWNVAPAMYTAKLKAFLTRTLR